MLTPAAGTMELCGAWSPVRPATSAAGWCPGCSRPGTTVRCLTRAAPAGCATCRGPAGSRSSRATSPTGVGLPAALRGVDVAYYLVHSLGQPDFEDVDRRGARTSPRRPRRPGVRRIVYLGGPEPPADARPSAHLRSRAEVGRHPAGQRRADRGAAGRGDHRLRLGVVRDAALPHRTAAGHGHAPLGAQPDPADRDPRRAALPGRRRPTLPGRRQPRVRHRRAGRAHLRRDDAAVRPGGRAAAPRSSCRCGR